ncbi:MAG: hypothetical protein ACFFCT_11890 [Candidatus Odinarchaeota archaeon]
MRDSLSRGTDEFLIADFASGEHDRVPSFFIQILPELLCDVNVARESFVYSIDLHSLRLDSLLGNLEESGLLERARVVQAKLESMDQEASLRPSMIDFIEEHLETAIWLDDFLIGENRFPPDCFDLGILNNDVIGYMHEYYKSYSDAQLGVQKVFNLIRKNGLLVVTMPCSLYVVDNISVLENTGFEYVEGIDIDLKNEHITSIEPNSNPETFSRLGHYTFLVFRK